MNLKKTFLLAAATFGLGATLGMEGCINASMPDRNSLSIKTDSLLRKEGYRFLTPVSGLSIPMKGGRMLRPSTDTLDKCGALVMRHDSIFNATTVRMSVGPVNYGYTEDRILGIQFVKIKNDF